MLGHKLFGAILIKPFVVFLSSQASPIDSAQIPSTFQAGCDNSHRDVAIFEKVTGSACKQGVDEKRGHCGLFLADIEVAKPREHSVERAGFGDRFRIGFIAAMKSAISSWSGWQAESLKARSKSISIKAFQRSRRWAIAAWSS